jgi:parvulin-like peptidyl-prolyl isomerase
VRRVDFSIAAASACLAVFAGCNSPAEAPARSLTTPAAVSTAAPPATAPASTDDIVAIVCGNNGGQLVVRRSELDATLYDAYGLQFLFDVIELDLAKSTLAHLGMTLTQADLDRERNMVMAHLFENQDDKTYSAEDREKYFEQLLERQHLTRTEFEMRAIKINACLRKIVEPRTINSLSDAVVRKGFAQMYGEKRQIADIQLANVGDFARAKQRLAAGVPFEQVAQQMSTDSNTAPLGGVWEQAFSAASSDTLVPKNIKDAAFSMDKEGQVFQDPLSVGTSVHLIKLLKIIPPKTSIVKYDDVKADIRKAMENQIVELKIKALREELTQSAQAEIDILQPELHDKWEKILDANRPKAVDKGKVLNEISAEDARAHTSLGARPPATMPGTAAPGK